MEGYNYVNSKHDEEAASRITKAPVISSDPEIMGITQRAINDLFKEIKRAKEEDGKHVSIFVSFL